MTTASSNQIGAYAHRVLKIAGDVDGYDATTTYTIEARLIGPRRSYSLVSDSRNPAWTTNNFEGFAARLIDIAGMTTP